MQPLTQRLPDRDCEMSTEPDPQNTFFPNDHLKWRPSPFLPIFFVFRRLRPNNLYISWFYKYKDLVILNNSRFSDVRVHFNFLLCQAENNKTGTYEQYQY